MGVDRAAIASDLAYAYLEMVFTNGFFHADPHPGNLFVQTDGHLAMVDFGMMGTVSAPVRAALLQILLAMATRNFAQGATALTSAGILLGDVDQTRFAAELEELTSASMDLPLGEVRIGPLLVHLMTVSRRHHLRFPRELGLLMKTVLMCEGVAAQLDPSFALPAVLSRFIQSPLRARLNTESARSVE